MDPNSGKLFRPASQVHLGVEEVGHGVIVEGHGHRGHELGHRDKVFHQQQIVLGEAGDAEAADLGVAGIAEEHEFGPGVRREPQHRRPRDLDPLHGPFRFLAVFTRQCSGGGGGAVAAWSHGG